MANVKLRVIDDAGSPVQDAFAHVAFEVPVNAQNRDYLKRKEAKTDKNGYFQTSEICTGIIYYGASKEGYYESTGNRFDYKFDVAKMRWNPSSPELIVLMKRVINPVPMYVREIVLRIPDTDKDIGYDLEKGDWVMPYGQGLRADFVFHARCRWTSYQDYYSVVKIKFSNFRDGIQEIPKTNASKGQLASPQLAPEDGYTEVWINERGQGPQTKRTGLNVMNSNYKDYIFRVRSNINDEGEITAANYGKIIGEIRVGGGEAEGKPILKFLYYYNSDPQSRSLEFDPKQNLAKEQKCNFPP
ncbi:hypothetical protein CKA38_13350 [Ereboglobus luteus]|uniref:Uncharacterized protein n=2 Tax=Ereboglobus luteus TaxID=1796921 RepID=A0A2U8E5L6_9BACT|nr:hypothetical protein CKA38_13350 [Ereboglobus luteus]